MTDGQGGQTFRILLLEDSEADVYLFRLALSQAGLNVELTVLEDGEEGLAFAARKGKYSASPIPDLVVLDMNLPKNGGAEVLETMRQNKDLSKVPVAVMTSLAAPRELARAKELGVACYLTKPPDLEKFLQLGLVLKEVLLKSNAVPKSNTAVGI